MKRLLEVLMVAGTSGAGGAFHSRAPRSMVGKILRFPLLWAIVGMVVVFVIAMVPYQAIDNPVLRCQSWFPS